jgi:hypothetical protein
MSIIRTDRNKFLGLQNLTVLHGFKFDPIKAYLNHSQELILGVELEVSNKIKKWDSENHSDPEVPDGFDVYESEVMTTGEFRPLLNKSMFLTIYSLFENEFVILCEYAGGIDGSNLRPKDLSGNNYIDRCRRFVTKVLNVNLDSLHQEWAEITKFQLLRNSFAHNNGILKDNEKSNIEFIQKTEGLIIDEKSKAIGIENDEFLMILIKKLVNFLDSTIEEIIKQKEKPAHNNG